MPQLFSEYRLGRELGNDDLSVRTREEDRTKGCA
jgi:hypothetical protein